MRNILLTLTAVFLSVSYLWGVEVKITASDAQADDCFGGSAISGDYVIVGASGEDAGGSDAGAAYIFYRSGSSWTQQAKITASDAQAGDNFVSCAISGDYAIVGASDEDAGGSDAGAAYIFIRSGTSWTQQAKITASDAEEEDYFGLSVSISGDYAIVGAYWEDPGDTYDAGAAYIFYRSGTDWTQQAKLTASDAEEEDYFGLSVSISGDYAIIGADEEDSAAPAGESGAAYIFYRSGTNWTQQAKITASDAHFNDYFGCSVSISGDYAIVGAYYKEIDGSYPGAAYIFYRSGTDWTQQAKITASDAQESDLFGMSVSISGDYAIVGAYGEDTAGSNAGAAYSYLRNGVTWTEKSKITASDAQADDYFGVGVSISSDYAIVAACCEDTGGSNAGAAYIYASTADLSLPVELICFTAEQKSAGVTLRWVTESEIENLGFTLERRSSGEIEKWSELASYITHPDLCGQGSVTHRTDYSFIDQAVIPGMTYEYRLSDVSYSGVVERHNIVKITVNKEDYLAIPETFTLKDAYPNPFNPTTTISYTLPELTQVRLSVFDIRGQEVMTLQDKVKSPGNYQVQWNGLDHSGNHVSTGVYFCRLDAGDYSKTIKMVYLK